MSLLELHVAQLFCEKKMVLLTKRTHSPPDISIPMLHNNLYPKYDSVEGHILNVIHKMYYHIF